MVFCRIIEKVSICFSAVCKKRSGWKSGTLLFGLAAAAIFLSNAPACATEPDRSGVDAEKVATLIYTCNTWGYLKPCST